MDHERRLAGDRRAHHDFVHHDFAHFDARERGLWTVGRWNQTCFDGRCGYWWLANGIWYYYATPVYPYPTVVSDVVYEEAAIAAPVIAPPVVAPVIAAPFGFPVVAPPYVAPTYVAPPAPQAPVVVQPSAAAQTRYYCDNPPGYFPAVQSCISGWRPATR